MSRPISSESVFRALAHPRRRRIVELLHAGDYKAGDLATEPNTTRPALSQHLRVLRTAGLVTFQRKGTSLVYHLNRTALNVVGDWVNKHRTRKTMQ